MLNCKCLKQGCRFQWDQTFENVHLNSRYLEMSFYGHLICSGLFEARFTLNTCFTVLRQTIKIMLMNDVKIYCSSLGLFIMYIDILGFVYRYICISIYLYIDRLCISIYSLGFVYRYICTILLWTKISILTVKKEHLWPTL